MTACLPPLCSAPWAKGSTRRMRFVHRDAGRPGQPGVHPPPSPRAAPASECSNRPLFPGGCACWRAGRIGGAGSPRRQWWPPANRSAARNGRPAINRQPARPGAPGTKLSGPAPGCRGPKAAPGPWPPPCRCEKTDGRPVLDGPLHVGQGRPGPDQATKKETKEPLVATTWPLCTSSLSRPWRLMAVRWPPSSLLGLQAVGPEARAHPGPPCGWGIR